jgi:hypothetical protein
MLQWKKEKPLLLPTLQFVMLNCNLNILFVTSEYMRRIRKINYVCKYCSCNAAVTMVRMHAEFVGSFRRHRRNFQTIEPRLRIVLCVYNVQENREARRMRNAVYNPFLECKKHETG